MIKDFKNFVRKCKTSQKQKHFIHTKEPMAITTEFTLKQIPLCQYIYIIGVCWRAPAASKKFIAFGIIQAIRPGSHPYTPLRTLTRCSGEEASTAYICIYMTIVVNCNQIK